MGGVHDYFCGMISMRHNGAQVTELIKEYLGKNFYRVFIILVSIVFMLVNKDSNDTAIKPAKPQYKLLKFVS